MKYKYDEKGNITEVYENGILQVRYKYDSLSRIIREDNKPLNKTVTWEYDAGGNILNRFEYTFTLSENISENIPTIIPYTYASSGIRDKLVSYNGETFVYDSIGNPTTYRGQTLTWSHGRQLDTYGNIASYTYNASGVRIGKTVGSTTTQYYLDGTRVLAQKDTVNASGTPVQTIMQFIYGIDGIIGFILNDTNYYYKKNLQGDVIGIYNNNLQLIAKYTYDAWGNHKISYLENGVFVDFIPTNSYNESNTSLYIALKNPFRYRSYYYDTETGLYYLNSRYYDPETGRFINVDDITILDISQIAQNGLNLYVYCLNNPVNEVDESGYIIGLLIGLLVGAAIGLAIGTTTYLASYIYTGIKTGNWEFNAAEFLGSVLGGIIGGMFSIIPGVGSYISAFVTGFVTNVLTDVFSTVFHSAEFNLWNSLKQGAINGVLSMLFVGVMNTQYAIKGLTFGRGSWSAVSKQIYTKFRRDLIIRIRGKTFSKMLGLSFYESTIDILNNVLRV